MVAVSPNSLGGYRNPTEDEILKINNYLNPSRKDKLEETRIFNTTFYAVSVILIISVIIMGMIDKPSTFEFISVSLITLLCLIALNELRKSISSYNIFLGNIEKGNFEVLDCISYVHNFNQEQIGTKGLIKVQTKEGLVSITNFTVDIETALLCETEAGKDLPMLLVFDRKTQICRCFTEKMLNEGK